jgi:hypothetical protein
MRISFINRAPVALILKNGEKAIEPEISPTSPTTGISFQLNKPHPV